MQSITNKPSLLTAILCALAPAAFAHDHGDWSAIHWHTSDILGVATVTALSLGTLWLARRRKPGGGQ